MIKSRLAPTPSGYLHFGNLLNFVLTWVITRQNNGTLLLRIDDADSLRAKDEYIDDIFDTLQWLGFSCDEGPTSASDFKLNYSQIAKKELYRDFLSNFTGYACDCSRQQVKARTKDLYDGFCRDRNLPLIPNETQWRVLEEVSSDDLVLWRKEDMPAYHLVSLVEDISYGTNLIVRGEDLKTSSVAQIKLAKRLLSLGDVFTNARFIHHPLLLDHHGNKMSKSKGSSSLKYLRESNVTPAEVFKELSKRACWKQEITSLDQALLLFDASYLNDLIDKETL